MQVFIGIASIKQREHSLHRTLTTLTTQAERIVVYLNDYEFVPTWGYNFPHVEFVLGSNALGDIGDIGKFYALQTPKPNTYFFSVDDDIEYPPDYIAYTKSWLEYTQGKCIIAHHGREFPLPHLLESPTLADYYRLSSVVHFAQQNKQERFVHFGGTGVMAFDTNKVNLAFSDFGAQRNIADIWVGVYAQKMKLPILIPPHNRLWLQQSPLVALEDSIYAQFKDKSSTLVEPLCQYLQQEQLHKHQIPID